MNFPESFTQWASLDEDKKRMLGCPVPHVYNNNKICIYCKKELNGVH